MKQFIEIPQDGESVLINVNHIAAIKSKSFGDKQICEIFVATPYISRSIGLSRLDA